MPRDARARESHPASVPEHPPSAPSLRRASASAALEHDLATLERARADVYDAVSLAPAVDPDERLALAPWARLIEAQHAVHLLWDALEAGQSEPSLARLPTTLLVWRARARDGYSSRVQQRALGALEARFFRAAALGAGATLEELCACSDEHASVDEAVRAVVAHLARGVAEELFVSATAESHPTSNAE